jgi:hypothetical protein
VQDVLSRLIPLQHRQDIDASIAGQERIVAFNGQALVIGGGETSLL